MAPYLKYNFAILLPFLWTAPASDRHVRLFGVLYILPDASGVAGYFSDVPGAFSMSPGAYHLLPGISHLLPGASYLLPGISHLLPGISHLLPGVFICYLALLTWARMRSITMSIATRLWPPPGIMISALRLLGSTKSSCIGLTVVRY